DDSDRPRQAAAGRHDLPVDGGVKVALCLVWVGHRAGVAGLRGRSNQSARTNGGGSACGRGGGLGGKQRAPGPAGAPRPPGVGAALAAIGLLAPLYLSAALAVVSAVMIWFFLPEDELPRAHGTARRPKLSVRDPRVLPFLLVATALQAVRATTVITCAFFLQD